MDLDSGEDLISMKETLQSQHSLSTKSPPSNLDADEYARRHGLTVDNFTDPWLTLTEHGDSIAPTITILKPGELIEDFPLQECHFRPIIPTSEQWELPPKSRTVLQDSLKRCKADQVGTLMEDLCFTETSKNRSLKQDIPLLRSDHEEDCRRVARKVNTFRKVPLPDHGLPIEPADVTKGEGLQFPSSAIAKDRELMKSAEEERLNMNHDELKYLVDILKTTWTDKDQKDLIENNYPYHGIGAMDPITPPLSPMAEPPAEEFVPDQDTCYIPEPSDHSSELSADILAAESRILQGDQEFWTEASGNPGSPERYDDINLAQMLRTGALRSSSAPPAGPEPITQDFYLDVPIFAASWHENDQGRTRVLTREDLDQMRGLILSSSDTIDAEGDQMMEFFESRATHTMRRAEQEQLQPLDAISRVPVPVMDFSIPRPEWEERFLEPEALMRQIRKEEDVDWQGPKWQNNRAAEQKMVWAPLAHMKRRSLASENIEVEPEVLERFVGADADSDVPTSAEYVYKQPGLAILRMDDDDEDDYITAPDQPLHDTSCVLAPDKPDDLTQVNNFLGQGPNLTSKESPREQEYLRDEKKRATEGERIMKRQKTKQEDKDSAVEHCCQSMKETIPPAPSTNMLAGFDSQFPELGLLINSFGDTHFPKVCQTDDSPTEPAATEPAPDTPPQPEPIPAIAPDIVPPTPSPKVVVSSAVSRPIVNKLEGLLPGMEVIIRDYGAHAPPGWAPGMRSPNLDEADITISPSTGILLSTMVKLRQKPLPGQAGNSTGLRRILQNVAIRYERLVFLISEGNKHAETMTPISQGDARALAEFQGFVAGCSTEVRVLYVGGGIDTLAKWIAKTICDHAGEQGRVRELLLPGQSYWEVFLNRTGMNVFAAQVILGLLQSPDDEPAVGGQEGQAYGLPFFVILSKEERIEMFSDLLGGQKVLERVSQAIDEPWGQRAVIHR